MGFDFKDFSIVPVLQDEVLFVMLDAKGDDISEYIDVSAGGWIFLASVSLRIDGTVFGVCISAVIGRRSA